MLPRTNSFTPSCSLLVRSEGTRLRFKITLFVDFLRAILYELGLQGKLTTDQLAKKWDNLKRRYKVRPLTPARPGPRLEGASPSRS